MTEKKYNVSVLDMQPIDPPVGGGRLRLLGLYHNLGNRMQTTYIGTYDWPGEKYRDHALSNNLREIDIPLSDTHFDACRNLQDKVYGKTIIDTTFHQLARLSPEYVTAVRKKVVDADVVVFSHPWIYPLVKDLLNHRRQIVAYDSQNVEGLLRTALLDDGGTGTDIVKEVIKVEFELCHAADIVLTCSHEDRALFNRLYNVPFEKMRVVPNGVFTEGIKPATREEKEQAKQKLGLGSRGVAIFIGSNYPPNVEAAHFILDVLAPRLPDILFIIAGGVGSALAKEDPGDRKNTKITGFLDDVKKSLYFSASDIAINPVFSGSGTNIKMFDFMAAGLPVLTTPVGARGIENTYPDVFKIYEKEDFAAGIKEYMENDDKRLSLGSAARKTAEHKYSWEHISPKLGDLFLKFHDDLSGKRPYFSVIIPTYERHDLLLNLMNRLSRQRVRDFEVIVVDQSKDAWPNSVQDFGFKLFYIHTDITGAVKARNTGAFFAAGHILAFVDDDCLPSENWLEKATVHFDKADTIGIEGIIKSNIPGSQDYRTVTNEGFEGIGFMTANLFITSEVFNKINGFDENFDNPHFREDTDFGWRASRYGNIPFAGDVEVFHPPHRRDTDRESVAERNKFFEKDALLLKKHPERYKELFLREGHWKNTAGFWENFLIGMKKYHVELPEFYEAFHKRISTGEGTGETEHTEADSPGRERATSPEVAYAGSGRAYKNVIKKLQGFLQDDKSFFPQSTLSVTPGTKKEAVKILSRVKNILSNQPDDVKTYFDTSFERYVFTLQLILEHKDKDIKKVLELGCSPGHLGMALDTMGMEVYGIDLNPEYLYKYPQSFIEKLHIKQCNFEHESIPYDENTFDCIIFTEVLEHIATQHPVKVLRDIKRVLSPGGILILSTPNVSNISNVFALMRGENIFWDPRIFYGSTDRHNREFTPREVLTLLEESGFRNIKIGYRNTPSNWNSKTAGLTGQFLAEVDSSTAMRPLFMNTLFTKAEKS